MLEVPELWRNPGKLERRKKHMSILSRCKLVLKDDKKFDDLADKIEKCVSTLLNMCAGWNPEVGLLTVWSAFDANSL
jgi:hypothetical protein